MAAQEVSGMTRFIVISGHNWSQRTEIMVESVHNMKSGTLLVCAHAPVSKAAAVSCRLVRF